MIPFHVGISDDMKDESGAWRYKDFDITPLEEEPNLEWNFVPAGDEMVGSDLENADALILLIPRFCPNSVPVNKRLALIARCGVGYDTVDQSTCTENAIALTNTPDAVRRPVAVAILTLMLSLTSKLFLKDKLTRKGSEGWDQRSQHMGCGLIGRTLGSLGLGSIGSEMFRLAQGFEMRFIANDPFIDQARGPQLGVEMVDVETLFREADILCVNCDLNDTSQGLVDARLLGLMKPTAYFINTARGPIMDQAAVTQALQECHIAGAGLDVFQQEPTAADDPLLHLDNVIVSPHGLAFTDQLFAGIGQSVVQSVLDVKRGQVPKNVVNQDVFQNPEWQAKLTHYRNQVG